MRRYIPLSPADARRTRVPRRFSAAFCLQPWISTTSGTRSQCLVRAGTRRDVAGRQDTTARRASEPRSDERDESDSNIPGWRRPAESPAEEGLGARPEMSQHVPVSFGQRSRADRASDFGRKRRTRVQIRRCRTVSACSSIRPAANRLQMNFAEAASDCDSSRGKGRSPALAQAGMRMRAHELLCLAHDLAQDLVEDRSAQS